GLSAQVSGRLSLPALHGSMAGSGTVGALGQIADNIYYVNFTTSQVYPGFSGHFPPAAPRVPQTWRVLGNLKSLPRPVWILLVGSFVNRFGSFVITFLLLYMREQGYGIGEAGLALGAYGVGSLASSIGGPLADRLGRNHAIAISMFSSAATMLGLSQARNIVLIAILTGLAGMTSEMYRPASSALITDLVPEERRVTAFAAYRLAINAGFAFGPAVAGLLAQRSFIYLFVGDAVTSIVLGIVALTALPPGHRSPAREEARPPALSVIARDRAFLTIIVATLLSAFVYFQGTSTFALAVVDEGFSKAAYGALISLNGVLIVLGELPLTALTQRLPARAMIALGMMLIGIGFGAVTFAHSFFALAATVVVWTLGEMVAAPIEAAYVSRLAPQDMRGRYHAVWGLSFSTALIFGPSLGARVYGQSPATLWALCAALSALAAAIVLVFGRDRSVVPEVGRLEAGPEIPGVET
ncbi:MAG TPA: MFS transporter, partial [Microvirga sp.]|nr:MFS transporter [Microvirga sp.]